MSNFLGMMMADGSQGVFSFTAERGGPFNE